MKNPQNIPEEAEFVEQSDFTVEAANVADELAKLPLNKRASMAKELGAAIKTADAKLSASERKVYAEMVRTLAAEKATSKTLTARLAAIRDASVAASAPSGTALVLLDFDAAAVLVDNQIDGAVTLGGPPADKPLSEAEFKNLSVSIKQDAIQFTAARGTLHVRGNALLQLIADNTSIAALRKALDGGKGPVPVWASAHFTDNIIELGSNYFTARHLSLTTTRFLEIREDVGRAFARSATYVGNSDDNDVRLFSLTATNPSLAGNQGINIVVL